MAERHTCILLCCRARTQTILGIIIVDVSCLKASVSFGSSRPGISTQVDILDLTYEYCEFACKLVITLLY